MLKGCSRYAKRLLPYAKGLLLLAARLSAALQEAHIDLAAASSIRLQAKGEGVPLQQGLHLAGRQARAELQQLRRCTGHDRRGDAGAG